MQEDHGREAFVPSRRGPESQGPPAESQRFGVRNAVQLMAVEHLVLDARVKHEMRPFSPCFAHCLKLFDAPPKHLKAKRPLAFAVAARLSHARLHT